MVACKSEFPAGEFPSCRSAAYSGNGGTEPAQNNVQTKSLAACQLRNSVGAYILLVLLWASLMLYGISVTTCQAAGEFESGLRAANAGDLDGAINLWTAEIQRNPRGYEALVNRGTAQLRNGRILQGIRDWYGARNLTPTFAYAFASGDFINVPRGTNRSLSFVKALEIDPDFSAAVILAGATYLDLGRKKLAAELFRKSIELTKNPMLKNELDYWVKGIESKQRR